MSESASAVGPARFRSAWNLLAGTLTKYAFLLISIVIGIFLMPFTMHHLGTAEYGLWMLAASMTAYFQLLDLGYGNGLVRQITHADAHGDEEEINTILSTFVVVYFGIGLLALAGMAALVLFVVPRFPNLSADQVTRAQWVLVILGARIAIGFPMSVFGAVTTARQRFALTGAISIVVSVLQAIATYVVLSAGYHLVPLVATTTAIGVCSYVAYAAAARATFPGMRLSVFRFDRRQVRQVTAFSFYLFLISIAIQVGTNVDNLVIGAYMGTSAIAVYTIAVRLAEYQRQFCGQVSYLMFPVVVRFHAENDRAALRATLIEGTRLVLGLVGLAAVCLVAFGPAVIEIWMGPGFEQSTGPLYVLALIGIVMVGQGPTGSILLGAGRHRLVGLVSSLDVLLNLGLSLLLVTRLGLTGVALGTAVPYAILNIGVLMPASCRLVGVPVATFARTTVGPTVIAATAATVAAVVLQSAWLADSLLQLVAQVLAVAVTYAVAFWFVGLSAGDRSRYVTTVARTVPGGQPAIATAGGEA
jgi:O-antigen/teichoic acid export membrane protein